MPRGGYRPGSGRKSGTTVKYQTKMRHLIEAAVTPERWTAIIAKAVFDAETLGDKDARNWLTPWVVGKPPEDDAGAVTGINVSITRLTRDDASTDG